MNWRNVIGIGFWDLRLTLRGRVSMALVILMPVLMVLLMGNVMKPYFEMGQEDIPHFKVAYRDMGWGIHGEALKAFLQEAGDGYFDLVEVRGDVEDRVLSGDVPAAILVLQNFPTHVEEGLRGEIQIIGSGKHPVEEGLLRKLVATYAGIETGEEGEKDLSPTGLTSFQFFSASMMAFFLLTSGMGIGSTLIDERNNGILDRIRAHPVRRKEYLLGKIMGNGIIGFTQGLIMILVTTLAFDVHWGGRPLALGLIILLLTFISCALGILFSTLMSSSGALTAAMTILLWFMSFVSGGFTGEPVLGAVGRFTVNHYAFEGIAALMRGGGISEVAGNMGILGLIALVLWVVGLIGFHRRFSYE